MLGVGLSLTQIIARAGLALDFPAPDFTLDFANDVNTNVLTVSRNETVGTYWDANGVIQHAAANVARNTWHPKTGAKLGLLIEEPRVNRLLYSNDFTQTWWTKTGLQAIATGAAVTDGLTTRQINEDASNGVHHVVGTSVTITAGHFIVVKLAVKAKERSIVRMCVSNAAGTNYAQDWFDCSKKIFGLPNVGGSGWSIEERDFLEGKDGVFYLYFRVKTAVDTTAVLTFGPAAAFDDVAYQGVAGNGILVSHAELQSGSAYNPDISLITTNGATATRAADRATHLMSAVLGWTGQQGTMAVKYMTLARSSTAQLLNLAQSGDTTKGQIGLQISASGNQTDSTVKDATDAAATPLNARAGINGDFNWVALAVGNGLNDLALNGAGCTPGPLVTNIVPPSGGATTAYLGHARTASTDTGMLNGIIARIDYWTKPLTRPQLQAKTIAEFAVDSIPGEFRNGVNCAGLEYNASVMPGALNTNYFDTRQASFSYYASKIPNGLVRVPYRWDRAQPTLGGALDDAYCTLLENAIDQAQAAGMEVVLDCHNYAKWRGNTGTDTTITATGTVNIGHIVDFYSKLSARLAGRPGLYGYDIMNESGSIDRFVHARMMQRCIDAIRVNDTNAWIFVESVSASPARTFPYDFRACFLYDQEDKLVYSAHNYFDASGSGAYVNTYDADGAYELRGYNLTIPFVRWLIAKGARGHIGETGFPASDQWPALARQAGLLYKRANLMVTWWQAGRAVSQADALCLEPADINNPVDHAQWATIASL